MFIYNLKINGNKLFKVILITLSIIVLSIVGLVIYKLFNTSNFKISDSIKHSDITEITPNNYTNILKATHENLDSYLGKEIKFSGYVYKVIDFEPNQFVLARDMLINSESFVVGFLCEYDKINEFPENSWVKITATISKGSYHNQDIPLLKITSISEIKKPEDPFIGPPDNTYIPTSSIL